MVVETKDIRNVIILGHQESGKTSVFEQLLADGGSIPKAGSVIEGNTVSDYNEDEIERKTSINSAVGWLTYKGTKINIIDTPGYSDFLGEVIGAMSAADAAILVVNAQNGIEIATDRFYKMIKKKGMPFLVFVNRMDKEHADFNKCMDQMTKKFGKQCSAVTYPIGEEASFKGVANLITKEGTDKIDAGDKDTVAVLSESLAESIAESDDTLLEKYLGEGALSANELAGAFRKAVIGGMVVPVFAGAATSNIGIREMLDAIVTAFPSPLDRPGIEVTDAANQRLLLPVKTDGPFAAQIFKTISDPYLGQISIMKVYSGKVAANANVLNTTQGVREKFGQIFVLNGKKDTAVADLHAGDIGCVSKLKSAQTGDTLTDEKNPVKFDKVPFPEPAISFSIKPKTRADEDKISTSLHKLTAEDSTFVTTRDAQTREMIISGMGDLHLNIMINRLIKRYGVQVEIGTPKVAYKETITGKGDAQYRHKKQSGGAGQFAEVWLRVEPMQRGAGFEFVDEIVGGSIPGPFVVSCEKGIKTALDTGILAGFPIVDVRAVVYDGKTHPVDSKDIAFQIAARHGFKEACTKAKPVILEPIMDVDVVVPDEYMGDITGSLNQRRGRIMGMEPGEGAQTIKAQVPLEEMYKYVNELKSITAGRGTYTMHFSHYEVVPSNIAQNIITHAQKNRVEEKEE
ncbi:MAG: elongation factor G [Candidatus Omnitrophica bacterium]|nr:elongation factor G [Candidatus Omnitrophota bacterium]